MHSKIDPDLRPKLEAELPGILAWAVKGCLDWQRYGLKDPEAVTSATASYRHEQDLLGDFIEDCCLLEPLATIPKADLKDEYQDWCQGNGVEPVTQRTFKARLVEKSIGESRIGKARHWRGIRLKTEVDSDLSTVKSDKTLGNLRTKVTKGTKITENSLIKEEQKDFIEDSVTLVTHVTNDNIPDYPTHPCRNCGCGDYWLTDWNQWLCSRCHPKPQGDDEQ